MHKIGFSDLAFMFVTIILEVIKAASENEKLKELSSRRNRKKFHHRM